MLESTTLDARHHILSGDNPADTNAQGIFAEVLIDSSWVIWPSILSTANLPFKRNHGVIHKIRSKSPSCDVDFCLEAQSIVSAMLRK